MIFSSKFISASKDYNTFSNHVPAPIFRKEFDIEQVYDDACITVCGLGFYEIYVNGKNITKGKLSPYIVNSDHVLPYDFYDLSQILRNGRNVIAFMLGNGMQNSNAGYVWDFDKASFRSSPKLAFALENNNKIIFEADESMLWKYGPITFDDLRAGERYDSTKEIEGFADFGLDVSDWNKPIIADTPKGEARLCIAPPIIIEREIGVSKIFAVKGGYIYDFGYNSAGFVRLSVSGANRGQKIDILLGEVLDKDGTLDMYNLTCRRELVDNGNCQHIQYIAKGQLHSEVYEPKFTYYGFRYAFVSGITKEQATPELLTMLIAHSKMKSLASFRCSDEVSNKLFDCGINSDKSNMFHFPTDCPHREKNGWTGDASSSAEHILLEFDAKDIYKEWLSSIRKAQKSSGALPGIVPTDTWGYRWGNGPMWDSVLTILPYFTYRYTGDREILEDNADAIFKYVEYLYSKKNMQGLVYFGLGDWVQPDRMASRPDCPEKVSLSIVSYNILKKAEFIFNELGQASRADFCNTFASALRVAIRQNLIDFDTMTVESHTQTAQSLAIYCGIFDKNETERAVKRLVDIIEKEDKSHIACGLIGLRVVFHALSDYGYEDLAYRMITQPTWPSYGNMIKHGATSLWENFPCLDENSEYLINIRPDIYGVSKNDKGFKLLLRKIEIAFMKLGAKITKTKFRVASLNHHFLGDINNWYITSVCGLVINKTAKDLNNIDVAPHFVTDLQFAETYRDMGYGDVKIRWERQNDGIILKINVPKTAHGVITLPKDWKFEDKSQQKPLQSGDYRLVRV